MRESTIIEAYENMPNLAGIPTQKERKLHLGICAEELGVPEEVLFQRLTENDTARDYPSVYLGYLANALASAYEELPTVKDRKIRPEREMRLIVSMASARIIRTFGHAA